MISRRQFMQGVPLGALSLVALGAPWSPVRAAGVPPAVAATVPVDELVVLTGDDVPSRIGDYPARLEALLKSHPEANDFYLAEGAVAELESRFAALLGKQDAVFMPTGTMANQIGIRLLCGERRRVLLQEESHVYRDEGDSISTLGGINPVPLAGGTSDALYDAIVEQFGRRSEDPYPTEVSAIALESPVRRLDGATVPQATVERIAKLARDNGAGMHLDGARLLLMSGIEGFEPKRYCVSFDTVYVSLYKYLGAPFGGVLAGDKAMMEKARSLRHIYGGTIYHGWMAALVASENLPGFVQRFAQARAQGESLLARLGTMRGIKVHRVKGGSNIAFLELEERVAAGLKERLEKAGILIGRIRDGRLQLSINETIMRKPVEVIAAAFAA